MIKKIKGLAPIIPIALLPFLPLSAFALGEQTPSGVAPVSGVQNASGLLDIVNGIINWIFVALLLLGVVFIFLAAFSYLTAQGDEEKIKSAKNELIYAIIAIVIGALAKAIVIAIASIAGSSATGVIH